MSASRLLVEGCVDCSLLPSLIFFNDLSLLFCSLVVVLLCAAVASAGQVLDQQQYVPSQ